MKTTLNGVEIEIDESELNEFIDKHRVSEVFRPMYNQEYRYIGARGEVSTTENNKYSYDKGLIDNFNHFPIGTDLTELGRTLKRTRAVYLWRLANDNVELDWENNNEKKWCWDYDCIQNLFSFDCNFYLEKDGFYFSTKQKAKDCLKFLSKNGLLPEGKEYYE